MHQHSVDICYSSISLSICHFLPTQMAMERKQGTTKQLQEFGFEKAL